MHKAIVATVGLLFLSVAALPAAVAGAEAGDPVDPEGSPTLAIAGGAAVASTTADATAGEAREGRLLALAGVESIGLALLAALGILLGAGVVLYGRARSSSGDGDPADAEADRVDGNGVPAASPRTRKQDADGGTKAVRTDEEYVVHLLIANHGRMRQAEIVEETDWSKAKVSRLLSRMEKRDQVVRERAGREKIVQLADANSSIPL